MEQKLVELVDTMNKSAYEVEGNLHCQIAADRAVVAAESSRLGN